MTLLNALKKVFKSTSLKYKLIDDKVIKKAFNYGGIDYFMFNDPFEVSTGRGLYSMTFYEEMLARVDREYLLMHVKAMENVLSNPSKTDIPAIVRLNDNLKERLGFQIALPDHVYKLASIIFFDENESPYRYDVDYNVKKIANWKKNPDMYAFFLQTPLKQLIPFLELPGKDTRDYLQAVEKIANRHSQAVQALQ